MGRPKRGADSASEDEDAEAEDADDDADANAEEDDEGEALGGAAVDLLLSSRGSLSATISP